MRLARSLVLAFASLVLACGSDAETSSTRTQTDAGSETSSPEDAGADAPADQAQADTATPEAGDDALPNDALPNDALPNDAAAGDASPEETALASYADALCHLLDGCAPYMLGYLYGDVQTCMQRYVAGGGAVVLPQAPGVARSPQDVLACADAMQSMSCDALYAGARDAACPTIAGTLTQGQDCFSDLQCESGFCDRAGTCGVCAPRLGMGDACEVTNSGCDDSQKCTAPTMVDPTVCTPRVGEGEACGDDVVCRGVLHCEQGLCAQPGALGASCDGSEGSCNGLLGLRCDGGTCQPLSALAEEGQPCGAQGGGYVPCIGTTYCNSTTKTCEKKVGDGEACPTDLSNTCLYFAACEGGHCVVDSEPTCP